MTTQDVIDEIKLELTGNVLDLEIEDITIEQVIKKALREIERYWDMTSMITVPFASCIDLTDSALSLKDKVLSIVKVYRAEGYGTDNSAAAMGDPMYAQQWLLFSNSGTMYNLNDYLLNYSAWQTVLKIKNTMSTELAFEEDRYNNKLYINQSMERPDKITIKYIPKLTDVEQINDEYWIDILIRMSLAMTKIVLGRIRTRFTQSNALWTQDGEKLLEEGETAKKELEEILRTNSNLIYGVD